MSLTSASNGDIARYSQILLDIARFCYILTARMDQSPQNQSVAQVIVGRKLHNKFSMEQVPFFNKTIAVTIKLYKLLFIYYSLKTLKCKIIAEYCIFSDVITYFKE